ncbi:MAG: gliding motility-associated C-terminal domain-containing protein [Bacteroidetes bacterium]|nr:gliding motility-associated C-terminal domain-containing protein [Bacteroidota bacterium]
MKRIFTILFSILSYFSFATHERAGEITFECLGGYTYSITITTYTKGSSDPADRCMLTINFGGGVGDTAVVCRSNFEPGDPSTDYWNASGCSCGSGNTHHMGEWNIGSPSLVSLNIKKNVYTTTHTYSGPGTYILSMTDANRNTGIVNMPPGNGDIPFSIQDTLKISSAYGMPQCNSSPTFSNPPVDRACAGKIFIHNPGASDIDGDSLSYKLGVCFEDRGVPIPGYYIPSGVSLDPYTGDFVWNVPPAVISPPDCDEYNFAIDVEEWALNKWTHHRSLIGTVRRDMQIRVCNCQNDPPVISPVDDTCILANTNLTLTVTATDVIQLDGIQSFTVTGGPFNTTPSATFTTSFIPPATPVTGIFSWTPTCSQVRQQPYLVTFKAVDDGAPDSPAVPLTDYESFFIRVIAPAPANLAAGPDCAKMLLSWNTAPCNNQSGNYLYKYKIYRRIGCDTNTAGNCVTGVPPLWGYTLIATVSNATTSYTDNNGGLGLVPGNDYSYRVTATYIDGAESYASDPVCKHLVRDMPIITNVDVKNTGTTNGVINIKWVKPLVSATDFDTILNPGPYKFELMRAAGSAPLSLIKTFSSPFFAALDTTYLDSFLTTQTKPYKYRVDFYHGTSTSSCYAQSASSVFLTCHPNDNQIQITWNEQVPWSNDRYDIYKFNGSVWDSIGTTTLQTFTDTGLGNGITYCYKVKSTGAYIDTTLPKPLINWSQELCCAPVDLTPPCPVSLAVDSSCDLSRNILTWNNPNNSCCDDALYYILYYSPVEDDDFSVLDTIFNINTTTFIDDSLSSIAGCYAVTSVDSFSNESAFSNLVCIDNCPYYELPNVFTPNGDGSNDFFTPLHPYKYVKDIDIKIYNRWGTEVFRTADPEIMWDGKSAQTKMQCSDGVYFYACIVNDIRLKGIIPRSLVGNVHLLSK